MKLHISDNKTILQIQREFSSAFPYLKLEFFSKPHKIGFGSPKAYLKNTTLTLRECRTIHHEGDLNLNGETRVNELEQAFRQDFGLNVQVFRKSGKLWLETTATDQWTLKEQNSQGEELDHVQDNPKDEEIDYHEQD